MTTVARAAFAAVLLLLLAVAPADAAPPLFSGAHFTSGLTALTASTFQVNSTAVTADATPGDGVCETAAGNGVCTYVAAVQESNASVGQLDTINFNLSGAAPHQITFAGNGPSVTDPAVIDATTNPDYVSAPTVLLKGPGPTGTQSGVPVTAGGTTIRGLAIDNFGTGINLSGGDGNVVEANYVGLTTAGTVVSGSANHNGVLIQNASAQNVIGGTTAAQRNVISGNGTVPTVDGRGIIITGAGTVDNVVEGNYIGVNPAGTAAAGNRSEGVLVQTAGNNLIGGSTGTTPGGSCTGACNLIGGNTGNSSNGPGITLGGSGTVVKGNFIGLNAAGTGTIPNDFAGIVVPGANNTIGGTTPEERNVISGQGININIDNVSVTPTGNVVQGNFIGSNSAGTAAIAHPAGSFNIQVSGANTIGGTTGTTPGGPCTGACNVIVGVQGYGIITGRAGGVTIQGNFVGLNAAGTAKLPNGNIGVRLLHTGNTVGGTTPSARNVIAGNTGAGVSLEATGNTLTGNYIGFSSDGLTQIPGGTWAVDALAANTIGGITGVTPGGACTGACNMILSLVTRGNGGIVQGNFVGGVRPDGLGATAGSGGTLQAVGPNSQIGGDTPEERNIISGGSTGMDVFGNNVRVQGNYIGVGSDGTTPVPNAGEGVHIRPVVGSLIGGTGAGEGNLIANNGADGIFMECRGASASNGHRVVGNSIFSERRPRHRHLPAGREPQRRRGPRHARAQRRPELPGAQLGERQLRRRGDRQRHAEQRGQQDLHARLLLERHLRHLGLRRGQAPDRFGHGDNRRLGQRPVQPHLPHPAERRDGDHHHGDVTGQQHLGAVEVPLLRTGEGSRADLRLAGAHVPAVHDAQPPARRRPVLRLVRAGCPRLDLSDRRDPGLELPQPELHRLGQVHGDRRRSGDARGRGQRADDGGPDRRAPGQRPGRLHR